MCRRTRSMPIAPITNDKHGERNVEPEDRAPAQPSRSAGRQSVDRRHCPILLCRRPFRSHDWTRSAGKALVSTLTETGKISAAPSPCSARNAMTMPADGASAHSTDATPNTRDAGEQRASPAEDVADPAGGHHEGAQREHVDADHPLQVRGVAAEILRHARQRQIHREIVDLNAEQRGRHRDQCPARACGRVPRFHGLTIRRRSPPRN